MSNHLLCVSMFMFIISVYMFVDNVFILHVIFPYSIILINISIVFFLNVSVKPCDFFTFKQPAHK